MRLIRVYEKVSKERFAKQIPHDVMVDDDDYPQLIKWKWIWRDGYACRKMGRTYYQMHRQVMKVLFGEKILVDHINGVHENCTKENLRRANRFENQQNRKTNEGNTLPKGVRQLTSGKYNVRIQTYGKRKLYGTYDTLEEALDARNKFAQDLHGEFFRESYIIDGEREN